MSEHNQWDAVWLDVNLATMTQAGYGIIKQAAVAVKDGKIAWLGPHSELPDFDVLSTPTYRGQGKWLTPGLIDCHTHLVFAGDRANEFEMRLNGASYEDIAAAGGGILSTVNATRSADEETLFVAAKKRAMALLNEGVTSLEIKSGYGLDCDNELKMLRVARLLGETLPQTILTTFLGAHALPREFAHNPQGYVDLVCGEMMESVAEHGLADAVDVFCEGIGFNLAQTEQVFQAAQKHNLAIKVHAEQLSNIGGTVLASRYQALSADHIEYLDEAGVKAMADAGMTAVVLPGAFYFLRETKLPPFELLKKYNVPIAVASDCNPGSSPLCSLQLMMNMACTLFKMPPQDVLLGVTYHAALALGIADRVGTLEVGKDADMVLWDINSPAQLCYQFGCNPVEQVIKQGQPLHL